MTDDDTEDPPVRARRPPPRKLDVSNELLKDVDTAPGVIRTVHLPHDALQRVRAKLTADQEAAAQDTIEGSDIPARSAEPAAR